MPLLSKFISGTKSWEKLSTSIRACRSFVIVKVIDSGRVIFDSFIHWRFDHFKRLVLGTVDVGGNCHDDDDDDDDTDDDDTDDDDTDNDNNNDGDHNDEVDKEDDDDGDDDDDDNTNNGDVDDVLDFGQLSPTLMKGISDSFVLRCQRLPGCRHYKILWSL